MRVHTYMHVYAKRVVGHTADADFVPDAAIACLSLSLSLSLSSVFLSLSPSPLAPVQMPVWPGKTQQGCLSTAAATTKASTNSNFGQVVFACSCCCY